METEIFKCTFLFQAERKYNSRIYDLKDRLDQSHSTNRSMQNYVQFLKSSYANVFGDSTIATSSPVKTFLTNKRKTKNIVFYCVCNDDIPLVFEESVTRNRFVCSSRTNYRV